MNRELFFLPGKSKKIYPPALEVLLESLICVIAFLARQKVFGGTFRRIFNDLIVVYLSPSVILLSLLNIHNSICVDHGLL